MTDRELRRGRVHDAEGAREAILNAAEATFAEHGFDGARIEAIARASSYNSSLIFHYFGDKLALYAEVVKRADREMTDLQDRVLTPLLEDPAVTGDPARFRTLLEETVASNFDYLVEHPRFSRMMLWEQAEGWRTFSKIVSQFEPEVSSQFDTLFRKAHANGLLRSDFLPFIQLSMVLQVCLSFISFIPLYQMAMPTGADLSSRAALERARSYILAFVVHGMMNVCD